MNEELLNLLREIADPTKCKLPEGWTVDQIGGERCFLKNRYIQGSIDSAYLDGDKIMDLLGRLSRAIEGEGRYRFERTVYEPADEQPHIEWLCFESELTVEVSDSTIGDAASEAVALAKCIRAACAVEVGS